MGWSLVSVAVACLGFIDVAAAELRVTAVERLTNSLLRLTFEDSGIGALNYTPAQRESLAPDATRMFDISSRILQLGPGRYQTTVADPADVAAFFQIAGFLPPDADADGLSDALEVMAGTSTNTFDTDGDGFGDANELVNGSDPLVGTSVPNVVRVGFAAGQSSGREGDGTLLIPITLSRSFTGPVRYSVATMSTAVEGPDFALTTGTINVSGTNGVIPIVLVDDLTVESVELLVIDLENPPDFAYQPGGASRHTVLLHDNDSHWAGVLRNEASEHAFRMRLLRQGGTVQAALVCNFDTNNTAAMQGVGSIPPGTWALVSATLTTNTFTATSVPIPMGASTLFGESALQRTLTFDANPASGTNYLFRPNLIMGSFTDRLSPANPGLAYLARQTSGVFVIIEELPSLPFPDPPAVPSPGPPQPLASARTREAAR